MSVDVVKRILEETGDDCSSEVKGYFKLAEQVSNLVDLMLGFRTSELIGEDNPEAYPTLFTAFDDWDLSTWLADSSEQLPMLLINRETGKGEIVYVRDGKILPLTDTVVKSALEELLGSDSGK